jgi:uncharacterized protein Yka (UPF0111/DUF47 family)
MSFSLLPKEYEFFDMFDNLAAHCVAASKQFQENMNKSIFSEDDVKKIKEMERAADSIVFEIVEKLLLLQSTERISIRLRMNWIVLSIIC